MIPDPNHVDVGQTSAGLLLHGQLSLCLLLMRNLGKVPLMFGKNRRSNSEDKADIKFVVGGQ